MNKLYFFAIVLLVCPQFLYSSGAGAAVAARTPLEKARDLMQAAKYLEVDTLKSEERIPYKELSEQLRIYREATLLPQLQAASLAADKPAYDAAAKQIQAATALCINLDVFGWYTSPRSPATVAREMQTYGTDAGLKAFAPFHE